MQSCNISVPRKSPVNGRQLELFPLLKKRQKPQISSVPGISIRKRDRYQVMAGARIIATHLDIDDALEIAAISTGTTGTEVDA